MHRRNFLTATALGAVASSLVGKEPASSPSKESKFRLGIVTYNIANDLDLNSVLKLCTDTGMAVVELRSTHKHGVEPTLSKEQRKEVRKKFANSGITCYGCGSACEYHASSQATVEKNIELTKRFVELTADIGGKGVKVRPNGLPKEVPVEKTLEQIGKALIPCGQAAKDAGVEIHVEVHGRGTAHPPHIRTIMDHCGHASVGVTWNCNPDDIKDGSIAEYYKLLAPWIRNCHIHELYHDPKTYPYRELFRLLRESGYNNDTLIEMGRIPKDVSARAEVLRYYKALWQELSRG